MNLWRSTKERGASAATALGLVLLVCTFGFTQSVSTTLQLDAPSAPVNELQFNLAAGLLGSDAATATLSGDIDVTFDLTSDGAGYDITGMTLTGGLVSITDVSFDLRFGVSADASGLAATPFTAAPPALVTASTFDSADHGLTVDQGTVDAAGSSIDFAAMPFIGTGQGLGSITMTPGTPVTGFDVFDVALELPVMFDEPFEIPDVPFVGTVTATFSGSGTMQSSGTIQIPIMSTVLACDADADGDCELDDLNAMYADISAGTMGGSFDFDGDGAVTADDIGGWLVSASDDSNTALLDPSDVLVVGDIDFSGDTDSTDLGLLLNNFGGANAPGWGGGDLNADLVVDSTDLGLLLNSFGHTSLAANAVPEPSAVVLWSMVALCLLTRLRSRQCRH